jgi:chlorophyll synthase
VRRSPRSAGSLAWRFADFAFLTRPLLLCVSTTFFFAGAAGGLASPLEALRAGVLINLAPNFLLLVLIVAGAFVLNQVYDVESDRLNEKNFHLSAGLVSRKEAALFWAALSAAALGASLALPGAVRLLGLGGLGLGVAYSAPPLRLKGRPVADMLANGLGFGFVAFALGWLALRPPATALLVRAAPYTAAMCAIFLNTTIPDEPGDRAAGDRTACVVLGRAAVSRAAPALLAGAAVTGMLAGETLCALAAAAALPAFIAVAAEPRPRVSVVASQFAGRAFFLVVSLSMPPFAILGGAAYWLTRAYYSRRFALAYPRLEGASAIARRSAEGEDRCRSTSLRVDS